MNDHSNDNPNDDDLVAYLDGELPTNRAEWIERQLAEDPSLRDRLKRLEQTWDMLDALASGRTDKYVHQKHDGNDRACLRFEKRLWQKEPSYVFFEPFL
ncbi:MAG: hypothetical protein R3C03_20220 [Pirellulaceae bacterium]